MERLKLWETNPAAHWIEAYPLGNGRLGAMLFGGPISERLQLNDITVWSGGPQPDANRTDAYRHLPQLKQLIRGGRYDEAVSFANRQFTTKADYDISKYQKLGDLHLEFQLPSDKIADYRRWLDLDRAVAGVSFSAGDVAFVRETFISAPDKVLAHRITANQPGAISFTLSLTREERAETRSLSPDSLVMTGDTGPHLNYQANVRVPRTGGQIRSEGNRLVIEGADEAVILLTAHTSYVMDFSKGFRGADPSLAAGQLESAAQKSFEELYRDHLADHQRYFRRVALDLGSTAISAKPTSERIQRFHQGDPDPALAALLFQFGRYLLISASRPDSPAPANLQGLWADELHHTPWNGDYTININFQMNYWPAEITGLSEMHDPMLRHIVSLVEPGANAARAHFGPETPGWVTGPKSNIWGWASPGAWLPWGVWFGSNGWLSQHLWERYAFTRDLEDLRDFYPIMKGAAEFWLATLVENNEGRLIVSPSSSPENNFQTDDGIRGSIVEGGGMDNAIVWELFDNVHRAALLLDLDPDFREKLAAARDRIQPPSIGRHGQLMEWNGDWDNPNDTHRHVSHLFPLHPGRRICPLKTPEWAEAARVTLRHRGDGGTGWAIAWKINFRARLREGDHAHKMLSHQLTPTREAQIVMDGGGTYPNLFCAHPPFQIDGNFGAVAGIAEMLLQSHWRFDDPDNPIIDRYYVDLLPALPAAWPRGSVSGLRARGGLAVDIEWADGALVSALIRNVSQSDARPRVRYKGQLVEILLNPGESLRLDGRLQKNQAPLG